MTTERIVGLIRRSNKLFHLSSGSSGYSITIERRKYKITAKQYNQILGWSLSSAAM